MVVDFTQLQAFKKHVLREYPKEACGVLVNGRFEPCQNTHFNPLESFRISAVELALWQGKGQHLDAILHSHPFNRNNPPKHDPIWPTTRDMVEWLKDVVPWGIVSTEGENVSDPVWLDDANPEPLVGRQFIHGINDCYSVIRDYYREQGITLPNYARGMDWWDRGLDLYTENFRHAGFEVVPREDIQLGDLLLMQVRATVVNHAAVVTGNNEILHHLFHRLSGYDRLDRWERAVVNVIRYRK